MNILYNNSNNINNLNTHLRFVCNLYFLNYIFLISKIIIVYVKNVLLQFLFKFHYLIKTI